jgi:4-amino-4-deoxy-L-arabinose transferase-like glycosyltransferase
MVPLQFGVPGGPELLIIAIVAIVIPFAMAYWVYTDAEKRGDDRAALWAVVVGGLTFLTFFGGLLALVVYVWQRD